MAMSYVIRKISPTVVPLALRAISLSSARVVLPESGSFRSQQFSTVAVDKKLLKVLKSEIKSMKQTRYQISKFLIESTEIPANFPFTMEDQLLHCIRLKRELPAEIIEVIVSMPIVLRKEDNNDGSDTRINKDSSTNDDESDTNNDNGSSSDTDNNNNSSSTDSSSDDEEKERDNANPSLVGVPLQVRIRKRDFSSSMKIQVFGCADEIIVEHIEISGSGSPVGKLFSDYNSALKFKEWATDLQNSVKEFIGAKGIDKTNVEFLLKYMVRRSNDFQSVNIQPNIVNEGHMHFLESFKKFVSQEVC